MDQWEDGEHRLAQGESETGPPVPHPYQPVGQLGLPSQNMSPRHQEGIGKRDLRLEDVAKRPLEKLSLCVWSEGRRGGGRDSKYQQSLTQEK